MKGVLLTRRSITPTPPLPPTSMARGFDLPVQEQFHVIGMEYVREIGTAGVEIETTGTAVVNEPIHVFLTGVAETRDVTRWSDQEFEHALAVERMVNYGGCVGDSAMFVEIIVTDGAFEPRSDTDFFTAVASERKLHVLQPEFVVWMAEVCNLTMLLHDC